MKKWAKKTIPTLDKIKRGWYNMANHTINILSKYPFSISFSPKIAFDKGIFQKGNQYAFQKEKDRPRGSCLECGPVLLRRGGKS